MSERLEKELAENFSLKQAKSWLQEKLVIPKEDGTFVEGDGAICPCCNQFAKVYRRKLHSSMAYILVRLVEAFATWPELKKPDAYIHVGAFINGLGLDPKVAASIRGDWTKLKYWSLIEPQTGERGDENPRNGYWRPTAQGELFVRGAIKVHKDVLIYNDQVKTGKRESALIGIEEALGDKFNYAELMKGWSKYE